MKNGVLNIGSRESQLALVQTNIIADVIRKANPLLDVHIVSMKTTGDKILDKSLDKIGGKGLFVKELDRALLRGDTDLSVHSLKDMPAQTPEALPIVAYSKREDPRDVLILPKNHSRLDLTKPVGCSSKRRKIQFQNLYPEATFKDIRGNVLTRLEKLDSGEYGALILAAAGIKRLGLEERIFRFFEPEEMIPAAGQGILGIQGRKEENYDFLSKINHESSMYCGVAERSFIKTLDGGCSSPVAAFGIFEEGTFVLTGLYYEDSSGKWTTGSLTCENIENIEQAQQLGRQLAEYLKKQVEEDKKIKKWQS